MSTAGGGGRTSRSRLGLLRRRLLPPPLLLRRALRRPRIDQRDRLLGGDVLGLHLLGQRGVGRAVGHVRPVAARHDLDLAAAGRMRAERLDRLGPGPAACAALAVGRFRQERDRGVHAGLEHVARAGELGVLAVVREVRAITADAGGDRLPRFGVRTDLTWQREQLDRPLEVEVGEVARNGRALGVLAFAELDIGPETAGLAMNLKPGRGIAAHRLVLVAVLSVGLAELPPVCALGVVRAGDERAEAAAAQRQASAATPLGEAPGALPWIATVGLRREQVIRQELVEHFGDFRGLALHDLVALRLEVAPELLEHVLPGGTPARNVVEFLLHLGGEVVGDVAREEALEERGQQAAGILGEEAVLLHPDVFAITQRLDGRRVSRGTPNAEFFEPLDQARLGIARRRLREVLLGADAEPGRRIPLAHYRQQAFLLVVFALLVATFLVDREEARELHDLPGRPQLVPPGRIAQ